MNELRCTFPDCDCFSSDSHVLYVVRCPHESADGAVPIPDDHHSGEVWIDDDTLHATTLSILAGLAIGSVFVLLYAVLT